MITEFELVLEEGVPMPIACPGASSRLSSVSVTAIPAKGARPRDVRIVSPGGERLERAFVELRFFEKPGGLRPVLSAACVGGGGTMAVLMGLYHWLVLDLASGALKSSVDLNRAVTEDSGFYRVQFAELGGRAILIYESGVVALSQAGELLWHVRKAWDDEFVGTDGGSLTFEREAQGSFAIDASSGRARWR